MTLINPEEELASTQELLASDIETIRTLLLRFGQVHACFVVWYISRHSAQTCLGDGTDAGRYGLLCVSGAGFAITDGAAYIIKQLYSANFGQSISK